MQRRKLVLRLDGIDIELSYDEKLITAIRNSLNLEHDIVVTDDHIKQCLFSSKLKALDS